MNAVSFFPRYVLLLLLYNYKINKLLLILTVRGRSVTVVALCTLVHRQRRRRRDDDDRPMVTAGGRNDRDNEHIKKKKERKKSTTDQTTTHVRCARNNNVRNDITVFDRRI